MSSSVIEMRRAKPEDYGSLNAIMRRASLAVETGEVLRHLLERPEYLQVDRDLLASGQVILAESGGVAIGFASFVVAGSDCAELDGMFVDPAHWRRGVGRLIFAAVQRELVLRQATSIRVVAGSSAVDFYRSMGFLVVGEEKTALGPIVPVMAKVIV